MKVITIGSALRDIFIVADGAKIIDNDDLDCRKLLGFEFGAKLSIKNFLNSIGGAACNVAIGLKRMGIDAIPYIEIGDDILGDAIKRELKNQKISTKLTQKDNKKQTGFSFIIVESRTREHVVFRGKEASEDININLKKILSAKPDWIYAGSMGKNPEDEYLKIKLIKKKKPEIRIAINPGISQIENNRKELLDLLKNCEILFINRDEAISMASDCRNIPEEGLKQMRFLLSESVNWGAKLTAISDGEYGAYLRDEKGVFYYVEGVPPKKLVDTTGAGDAFCSGFLSQFIKGESIEDCLRIGVLNGSKVVEALGAWQNLMSIKNYESKITNKIRVCRI